MAKRVQVVLAQPVSKLGQSGEVVEVAPGYARNYLIPKGLAVPATRGVLQQVARREALEAQRKQQEREEAVARKTALETIGVLTLTATVGEKDSLFGSVTDRDIAEAILAATGKEVDRRGITVPEVRKTGSYEAEVKLHPEVMATVRFRVVAK
ncbi:MAG: 50S ribosomal protein L9 [Gloeomargaritaceae cyanobacterium C42_A2020_066]|nr:50S ribosomal protein L9 [Gloeomargaritaceae cyanobacterium C42_A2020_066]